jgi:pimeloyl-ACP methyl ester carboxylesterase
MRMTSSNAAGQYVQANGLNIHYTRQGSGAPLVLLHGGTATLHMWEDHLPAYTPHFEVFALDSRGHGRTINPDAALRYPQMADDVAAAITALGLDRPTVMGYSDGGVIALELGIRYPDRVRALVIGGAAYRADPAYFAALRGMGMSGPGEVDFAWMEREQAGWIAYMQQAHVREHDADYWRTFLRQIAALWWNLPAYSDDDLRRIPVPALLFMGDRDTSVSVEQGVQMYRLLPHGELAIIPNGSHDTALAAMSSPIVTDFLRRHAGTAAPTR